MGKAILYTKGQSVGTKGIIFISYMDYKKHGSIVARFKCSCGKEWETRLYNVVTDITSSCGCYAKQESSKRLKKHGLSKHPLASRYYHMMERCYKISNKDYKYYKNISIEPFLQKLENYILYLESLPNALEKDFTVDRIDNTKDYVRGNLRWANHSIQQSNKSNRGIYTGVKHIKNVFVSRLVYKRATFCIGTYKTSEQAVFARNRFIVENSFPHQIQQIKIIEK